MTKKFRFEGEEPVTVNYIVDALPDYVKQNTDVLVQNIQFGTPTIKRVTLQTGIKTTAAINFLSVDVPLQDGKGCCIQPDGSATLSQRNIETGMIAKVIEVCPDTLLGKWPEYLVRVPADDRDNLPFEEYLLGAIIAETQAQLEEAVWQSDSSNGGFFDGYLTILAAEGDVVPADVSAAASYFDAIKAIILAIPAKTLQKRPKIFLGTEVFMALSLELVEKNLFHFAPDADLDSITFPGTTVEIFNTPGLANTNAAVATYLGNMFYGTDVEDAERRFKVVYDAKCDNFLIKFRWNSGVQVAFPDEVVVADLSDMPSEDEG